MAKRALIVGLNWYEKMPILNSCVADAVKMKELLSRQEDGYRNYFCDVLTSDVDPDWQPTKTPPEDGKIPRPTRKAGTERVTTALLRKKLHALFRDFDGDVVIYFSGHGDISPSGGFLATEDAEWDDIGFPMEELFKLARDSPAYTVLIILDCCKAGAIVGTSYLTQAPLPLREGMAVLASSGHRENSKLGSPLSLFTQLLAEGLEGGAADERGRVNVPSLYLYVSQALGGWDQRPICLMHSSFLPTIRRCDAEIEDQHLWKLTDLFPKKSQVDAPEEKLPKLKFDPEDWEDIVKLRNAGLAVILGEGRPDPEVTVSLTDRGFFYWRVVRRDAI